MNTKNQPPNPYGTLDTHAGMFLTRLNPDGKAKRLIARFDNDSTPEEQTEVMAALNSHAALVAALEKAVQYLEAHRPKGKIRDIFHDLNEYENGVMKPARAALAAAKGVQS